MKTVFSLILIWALLLPCSQAGFAQDTASAENHAPPVSEKEIQMMLATRGGFTPEQIVEIIQQRGISFRLTDSMRKSLQKAGASPLVMAALQRAYADLSRGTDQAGASGSGLMSAASAIPAPPPPPLDAGAAVELIEQARQNALTYSNRLPNFICQQLIKRMYSMGQDDYFHTMDTIYTRVAYNDHRESYQVDMVNNRAVDQKMESLGGATSTGEFGSLLREVFVPESQAEFKMYAAASLRGRPVYVYTYRVDQAHSKWQLYWEPGRPGERHMVPGYSGRVVIDAQTHQVLRIWLEAQGIPADFPIQSAVTTLDYDWAKIADQAYLLPSSAIMQMRDSQKLSQNEITFRGYRKFSAETVLKFGDIPDEPPGKPEPAGRPTTPPAAAKPPAAKPPIKK